MANETVRCDAFETDVWLLISDELDSVPRAEWREHLTSCRRCAATFERSNDILTSYDRQSLEPRLETVADDLELPAEPRFTSSPPWWIVAAASAFLAVVSVAIGYELGRKEGRDEGSRSEARLERRVEDLELRLALADLQRPSSVRRLHAVAAVASRMNEEPQVVDALVEALSSDPSPNVRMAALDHLYEARDASAIGRRFGELIEAQDSKLLVVALIELAADRGIEEAGVDLSRLLDVESDAEVRSRATWALERLGGGTS